MINFVLGRIKHEEARGQELINSSKSAGNLIEYDCPVSERLL